MSSMQEPDPDAPPLPAAPPAGAPKAQFRAWGRMLTKVEDPATVRRASEAICDHVVAYCREFASICTPSTGVDHPPTLMLYVPIRGEVDPIRLASWAFQSGWRVCVGYGIDRGSPLQPVMLPADAVTNGTWNIQGFEEDAWGVPVPRDRTPVRTQALDMVVVPGVAFDTACHRLGRGAGVYDRFLSTLGTATRRVGVAMDARIVPALPTDPHDIPMHLVATERRVLRP